MCRYLTRIQILLMALVSIGALTAPRMALADPNNVYAVTCTNNPVHVADFVTCARAWEVKNGVDGLLIVVNPTAALTAFVQSTGTYTLTCNNIFCFYSGGTLSAVNQDGTPLTTDSQLTAVDELLFAQMRKASILSKPIPIDPEYGGSYINNPVVAEDTNSAINKYLYIDNNIPSFDVPVGTKVTVKWSDGTTAQFVKVSATNAIQWVMVPGTAKNANGDPINPDGSLVTNPKTTGTGTGKVKPVVTASPGYNWTIYMAPRTLCGAEVDVYDSNGNPLLYSVSFLPCP